MKYLSIIIVSIFFLTTSNIKVSAQSEVDKFEVKVDGLGCPFCAYGLEKKFKELKGINDVKIEMETGVMTFAYPTAEMLTMERIEKQVDEAGYTAVKVSVTRADGSVEETEAIVPVPVNEDEVIERSFFVAGNCAMCKARIEKTTKSIAGVSDAEWNKKSKQLTVKFDQTMTSQKNIEDAIVAAGHDTKSGKANDVTYEELPACCQYDREQ